MLKDTTTKLGKTPPKKKVVNKTASSSNSDKHDLIGFAEVTMNVTQFNME